MFDTAEIPSGVYFVTIQASSGSKVYKLIVLK
ncbi:T9SS C-terminal target domain-containing protein [Bacteroidetes/Chlorobi group bacterium MS-B_bin-24]|nr:MAG: T9SS C-terminal target domain-containing protein [Bacteroidetes/Chlorobi group bacterium MS-B_bin-24]